MKRQLQQDFRAAVEISEHLASAPQQEISLSGIREAFTACERWQRRLEKAGTRGWLSGRRDSTDGLRGAADRLRMQSQQVLDDLAIHPGSQSQPSASDIYQDLRSLRDEFEIVTLDRKRKRLSVRTPDIELDGIYLRSFDIHLNWEYIKGSSPYDVVAVDANPAGADGTTTHPHVQNEQLCEGEGSTVIRRALSEGRLFDFFTVVDRILRTYNPDSAYVAIADWQGVTCGECGSTADRDDCCRCAKCGGNLCDECRRGCCACSDHFCTDCVSSCTACDDDVCQTCLQSCDDCGESFCSHCLTEGICDDCINHQNEEQASREAEQTGSPLYAVRLGEAALPA